MPDKSQGFNGCCTAGLVVADDTAPAFRITPGMDVITDVYLSGDHSLQKSLRKGGLSEVQIEGAPICRWKSGDVTLELMPIDHNVSGFGSDSF